MDSILNADTHSLDFSEWHQKNFFFKWTLSATSIVIFSRYIIRSNIYRLNRFTLYCVISQLNSQKLVRKKKVPRNSHFNLFRARSLKKKNSIIQRGGGKKINTNNNNNNNKEMARNIISNTTSAGEINSTVFNRESVTSNWY
jgi:hypothetical protein